MSAHNPVVWFEIYVDNMERASKFYERILSVKLQELPNPTEDDMQMKTFEGNMESYGGNGALVKMNGVKAGGNSTLVYFGSKDCTTEERRIEKAGGKIIKPKMSIGEHGFITLFSDTEGNMVGLHSME
ncbi:VOC family protein [Gelidibacter mesophilus]|uniref:VOC family protein n=1 Tax=Gelidibacter mesophilus TaxID=169050 RepID=UPI0004154C92|nr:VOC family protein [Gelidibacter mesophilus]